MFKIIFLSFCSLLFLSSVCFAESSKSNSAHKKQVIQNLKKMGDTQKKLARDFKKLSASAKAEIIQKTSNKKDSDGDSINDFLEGALNLNKCSPDTDGDNVSDSDEYESGSNPNDDDSDNDGKKDGAEMESHGLITAISPESVTVSSVNYALNEHTTYYDKDNNIVLLDSFSISDCVEIEGYSIADSNVATKMKGDDDCN